MSKYTRENPSPKYKEYLDMYKQMHKEGDALNNLPPEKTFSGISLKMQIGVIKNILQHTNSKTMLDYGCGKAQTYDQTVKLIVNGVKQEKLVTVRDLLKLDEIRLYDPANEKYDELPTDQYDGVICTDVLEHVLEEDIEWVIRDLFAFSKKFVFANVACYPAMKILPNGENAHCTIKSLDWWTSKLYIVAAEFPDLLYRFDFSVPDNQNKQLKKYIFANFSLKQDQNIKEETEAKN